MGIAWRAIAAEIETTAERYLLAVSGGVDSMFMLDFFHRQCRRPFSVAHFDHGLRDASVAERDMVAAFCAERGIAFRTARGDPDAMRDAPSLEAEARRQRYAFLEALAAPGDAICTGHHANDQLETVLLRLMRGYPDDALRMRRHAGNRYKPFLGVPKEEILRQAGNRRIPWMEDESNASLDMERNWVRNSLVPQMMERRNVLRTIGMREPAGVGEILLTGTREGARQEAQGRDDPPSRLPG